MSLTSCVVHPMCPSPASHFLHVIDLLYFCEVNTQSRKLDTLNYCRLSSLVLLLVNKVDLLPDFVQNYSKSEKRSVSVRVPGHQITRLLNIIHAAPIHQGHTEETLGPLLPISCQDHVSSVVVK